jgi:hypothetical protein
MAKIVRAGAEIFDKLKPVPRKKNSPAPQHSFQDTSGTMYLPKHALINNLLAAMYHYTELSTQYAPVSESIGALKRYF